MLDELVQGIEVDVGEELAGEIADGQPAPRRTTEQGLVRRQGKKVPQRMTPQPAVVRGLVEHHHRDQPTHHRVGLLGDEPLVQTRPVDGNEKAFHVELQIEGPAGAVGAGLAHELLAAVHALVGALAAAAGIGVVDEPPLPARLQLRHQ